MTEAVFTAAIVTLVCAILVTLYGIVRNVPPQPNKQSYRRHRPWNFK
jgi:hypothetical protein